MKANVDTNLETTETNNIDLKSEEENDNIEMLDLLLSFLETDAELNHVLAGYFSKFMLLLLAKQQKTVKELILLQFKIKFFNLFYKKIKIKIKFKNIFN